VQHVTARRQDLIGRAPGGGFVEVPLPLIDAVLVPSPVLFMLVMLLGAGFAFRWTRWGRCLPGQRTWHIRPGRRIFRVRARDAAGNQLLSWLEQYNSLEDWFEQQIQNPNNTPEAIARLQGILQLRRGSGVS